MLNRSSLVGLLLFLIVINWVTTIKAGFRPQVFTLRVIASGQTIADGQSIFITQGQSVQLTIQLVNPDNSVTDVTNNAETVLCSLTPWNTQLSPTTKGLVTALIDPSYGVTLSQSNVGAVAIEYLGGGNVSSRTVLFTIAPGANVTTPSGLNAFTASTSQVNVTWNAVSGTLQNYQVERSTSISGPFSVLGTSTTTSYNDTTATTNNAYIYRVKAIDTGSNSSPYSNMDLATVWAYADDPVVSGVTGVKALHINDLRNAANAARAAVGLSAYPWVDTITTGFSIKAQHITELRTAINAALAMLDIAAPNYTDPGLTRGTPIRAAHINDLRTALK